MAVINDLIERISDPELRRRISEEVARMQKQKKFGLVFEEHLPEATPLYDIPIKKKSLVSLKDRYFKDFYLVKDINGDKLICEKQDDSREIVELNRHNVVAVAQFGQPIYPYLKPMDAVKNAPDSDLWHTLIEADNYHALQLLVYLYGGMVDCIYIDPPYNTGDKSWKYNNDYVDSSDAYRHSKWLSMMKKRLLLAKKLLNPKDSVLIVTIDEKEYLRLGCLLEELFPDANMQMVSSAINGKGVARGAEFFRVNEYIYVLRFGDCGVTELPLSDEWLGNIKTSTTKKVRWGSLMRSGTNSERSHSPGCFYPIFISSDKKHFCGAGNPLPLNENMDSVIVPEGQIALFPIHDDGSEGVWQYNKDNLLDIQSKGYVRISTQTKKGKEATIRYISEGWQKRVENGEIAVMGKAEDGSLIFNDDEYIQKFIPSNQWWITSHDATEFGSKHLLKFIGKRFDFPKSIYAEHDVLRFFVADKPNALVVDFFAGSGTTLHALNILNAEDGGHRRCVMVTNNEVSAEEETKLKRAGYHPGQDEWEKWGIARYVNWPRTKCSILGVDVNGNPINGSYQTYLKQKKEKERIIKQITLIDNPSSLTTAQKKELVALCCQGKLPQSLVKTDTKFIVSEDHTCSILLDINYVEEWLEALEDQDHLTELYIVTRNNEVFKKLKADIQELLGNIIEEEPVLRPMSDGFKANAKYFKLGFLDKYSVEAYRQFRELLPLLWMKAGAIGECPTLEGKGIPSFMILDENKMAILTEESNYAVFLDQMKDRKDIKTIFLVVDSEIGFREMAAPFKWAKTYQLYKDYLENFSINYDK